MRVKGWSVLPGTRLVWDDETTFVVHRSYVIADGQRYLGGALHPTAHSAVMVVDHDTEVEIAREGGS